MKTILKLLDNYWHAIIIIFCALALSGCVVYPYDYACCASGYYSNSYYGYNYGYGYAYPYPYVSGVFISGGHYYDHDGGNWGHGGGEGGHGWNGGGGHNGSH